MAGPATSTSRSHDSADATHHGSGSTSARSAAEVIAITQRDDFLLELGEALAGQFAVHPVDSVAKALEHTAHARRAQLVCIDSRDVSDLRADVEHVHAQAPGVPIVVFAVAESEKSIAGTLRSSNVFAVLPIPVDKRKTAAVVEGAAAENAAKRTGTRSAAAGEIRIDVRSAVAPEPPTVQVVPETGAGGSSRKVLVGAVVAVVLVAAAGAAVWMLHSGSSKPQTTAPAVKAESAAPAAAQPAPVEVPLATGNVDELLEKARNAMRERRYTEPANDSALLYYRSALKVDRANGEARDGMGRLASLLLSRFDESLAGGHLDEAAGALAGLKTAVPGDTRVPPLEFRLLQAEVNKALADGNLDRVAALVRQAQGVSSVPAEQLAKWRQEVTRRQDDARAKHLADLFGERLRDGKLVDPDNDNAKYYLQQLSAVTPSSASVQRDTRDLIAAYLKKGREAAAANRAADADHWLAEARALGLSPADASAYQKDVSAARARAAAADAERLAQLVRDRLRDGRLTDPAQDSAAYYATQLRESYPDSSVATTASRDLAARLLERARGEASAGQSTQVDADTTAARRWGASEGDIQSVQQLASRSKVAATRAPAALPTGFKLKRTRYELPEYPQRALDAKIESVLTVEFIVGVNGVPHDARVVASEPPTKAFDNAAITAVSHWRFEPVVINNVPTEVPTRTVMRFELPK